MKRKQTASQLANLKPFNTLSESEQRAIRSMGGKAGAKAREHKKSMREWAVMIGNMQGSPEVIERLKGVFPNFTEEQLKELTNNALMVMRLFNEAIIKGNMRAYDVWLELTDQKATQKHEVITHQEIDISKVKNLKKLLDD